MTRPLVHEHILALEGYAPGEQPEGDDFIKLKLNTNENPYGPSPRVIEAIARAAADDNLRLYPEPTSLPLRQKAADVYGVPVDHIIAGNGTDDILTMLVRAFVAPGGVMAGMQPDYLLYKTLCAIQGGRFQTVPGWPDPPEIDRLAELGAPVFLSSPTNPTGALIPRDFLRRLAEAIGAQGQVLVIDEAYADFAEANCLALARELDNVVVLRSFSKSFSLAGMRVGLGFAAPSIIAQLMKIKDSYNLDRLAIAAGVAALADIQWMRANAKKITMTRARLDDGLQTLGFDLLPSQANFVLCRPPRLDARAYQEALRERGILIRHYDVEPIREWVRISVGTDEQIDVLLSATDEIVNQAPKTGNANA